jgi:hypothetical protein
MRPTESAKMHLDLAKTMAFKIQISDTDNAMDFRHPLGVTLGGIVYALHDIAVAQRATYMLLEKIEKKLDRR